jgi:inner membrane protein
MRKSWYAKVLAVGLVAILLLIPLALIASLVSERARMNRSAEHGVQHSFAGPQRLILPWVIWPYVEEWSERRIDAQTKTESIVLRRRQRHLLGFAESWKLSGQVEVLKDRRRGIFTIQTFDSKLRLEGLIAVPVRSAVQPSHPGGRLVWGDPRLVMAVSDMRGLREVPHIVLDEGNVKALQGTGLKNVEDGFHLPLDPAQEGKPRKIAMDLRLAGTQQMSVVPNGGSTVVDLSSNWPHPRFEGNFLPDARSIADSGFTASWSIVALRSTAQSDMVDALNPEPSENSHQASLAHLQDVEIGLMDPVDIYVLTDRSLKYGILMIGLVFTALLFHDSVRRLGMHPIQYLLVGSALAVFFLVLLGLAEHIGFAWAYLLAATACIALIAFYLRHAFKSLLAAYLFGAGLYAAFGAIYVILQAEDTALLMGSLLVFSVLAAVMIATRNTDWHSALGGGRSDGRYSPVRESAGQAPDTPHA